MENELKEINRIIRRIENLQTLEKNQNIQNENKKKKNEAKIEELKGKIQQNQNWQQSFKPEEPEYEEFLKENEELKQQIVAIEKENRALINEGMAIRSGKANFEAKEKIEKEKQELKETINNQRKFLIRNRNVNIQEKMAELNEKRKRFRSDIEASERGIKIEEEIAERTGKDDALKFKKKMLEKRIKEFEENKAAQENETEIKKYGELAELFATGDVLKEIERLDLVMKEIDKLSIENVKIDRNVFMDNPKDKMDKIWEEAIKEDQMKEKTKKRQQEEEAKKKQQEEEKKKKQQEEEEKKKQQEEAKKKQQDKKENNEQQNVEPVKLKYKEIDLDNVEDLCVQILENVKLPENWIKTEEAQKIVDDLQKKCELLEKGLENETTLTDKEKNRLNEVFDELKNFNISEEIIDKIRKKLEKQTEQNKNSDKYKKDILDDPKAEPNRDKRLPIDIEVNLGRKGYIIYDRQKYKISKKALKDISNLDYLDIRMLIEDANIEIKEPKLLTQALKGKAIDYAVIKGICSAKRMNNTMKVDILNTYLKECMQTSEFQAVKNSCNIVYDLNDLSKLGGMDEMEKHSFLERARKAERFNIGEQRGEYKPTIWARAKAKLMRRDLKQLSGMTREQEEEVARRADQIMYKQQTVSKNKEFVNELKQQAKVKDVDFGEYKNKDGYIRDGGTAVLNDNQVKEVEEVVKSQMTNLSKDKDGR